MNIIMLVNGLNGQYTLSNVKFSHIFRKCVLSHQKSHHVTTREIFHDKIQVFSILKGVIQFNNAVAGHFCQQVSLCSNMLHLQRRIFADVLGWFWRKNFSTYENVKTLSQNLLIDWHRVKAHSRQLKKQSYCIFNQYTTCPLETISDFFNFFMAYILLDFFSLHNLTCSSSFNQKLENQTKECNYMLVIYWVLNNA